MIEKIPPRIYRPDQKEREHTPRVTAFQTEKGSVYSYDNFGRTTRHKATTGEIYPAQDLTVFVDMEPQDKDGFVYWLHHSDDPSVKVYVVEKQPNGAAVKIRRPEDVRTPDQLYLVACQVDEGLGHDFNITHILKNRKAQLEPAEGLYVYDTRRYTGDDGKLMTERHLGHRVTEIR